MKGKITRDIIENKIGKKIAKSIHLRRYAKCGPTMIPPIPDSKFIDKLPEVVLEGQNVQEKEHQDAYEAEVKVYRCLEELKKNYIVIHQLKFTHEQYSAFVYEHSCNKKQCTKGQEVHLCHKELKQIEGECDFVLVGDKFVAIFEVKGVRLQNTGEDECKFIGCCESALLQRKIIKDLIKSIVPTVMIFEFTVLPNVSIDEIKECFLKDDTILFSEDLEIIASIMDGYDESSLPTMTEKSRDKLYRCLTGLWCIDHNNKWNVESCELTECIKDSDQKLRKALVTRKAVDSEKSKIGGKGKAKVKKKYPENLEMVDAPELFKNYLDINCLTQDQLDVFNCDERFLWVEGPAGSGKTIAMLGKIIDIVLNKNTKSKGRCPKLKNRERLLLYYYSYTIVYDFTARITIVILNILKYSIDNFISVLR